MKNSLFILSLTGLCLIFAGCNKQSDDGLDIQQFINPPQQSKVHTWWHWMDGAITKEGITRDLEAMKEQGISQATILNIGLFKNRDFGVPRVDFNTEQWYEMFKWAVSEANRLGITLGAHNCDGWSSSGGPWIKPQNAMKQYSWAKTQVTGGQTISIDLPKPFAVDSFYADVAVLAYKQDGSANKFTVAKTIVSHNDSLIGNTLTDGSPVSAVKLSKNSKITIAFEQDFEASEITLHPRKAFMWGDLNEVSAIFSLSASTNGKSYKKITDLKMRGLNKNFSFQFEKAKARFFRLEVTELNNINEWLSYTLAEIHLSEAGGKPAYSPGILFHQEKVGAVKIALPNHLDSVSEQTAGNLAPADIVDLTGKLTPDGKLNWNAPAGNWTIVRFGYTITDAHNAPATPNGYGRECDKMDSAAVSLHFKNFPQKLIDAAGNLSGSTFKFLLIDSWECSFQNWTNNFPAEFEKRRGYSLNQWIPVLCGDVVGSVQQSEAFLYDYRRTIADLIEEYYYKHFSDLCHKNKLEMHAEAIYGGGGYPPLDILRTNKHADMPMFEFWAGHNVQTAFTEYTPTARPNNDFPASAALFYDKPVLGSEAYTAFAHYSESPTDLKPFGDRAFCTGINQMILHSYVHQPTENKPGMTLGHFASHFNRHNPWWQFAKEWMLYQNRIQYILQKGTVQNDVLFYLGDQLPQFTEIANFKELPLGYNANFCNFDILNNKLSVSNGKLNFGNKASFSLLCLPNTTKMELATLKRIEELVNNGAIVYAPKPTQTLSLQNFEQSNAELKTLAAKLWGKIDGKTVTENQYGNGKIIWGKPIATVLKEIELLPDFTTGANDSLQFLFIHKKIGNLQVYFVANQTPKNVAANCLFRVSKLSPQVWSPENGTVSLPVFETVNDLQTAVKYNFKPFEAVFFVFTDAKADKPLVPKADTIKISNLKNTISFTPAYNSPQIQQIINNEGVEWFTNTENTAIKYFSGTAKYEITFDVSENIQPTDSVLLNIGNVEAIANVTLNGKNIGIAWTPTRIFNVTGLLKNANKLEIEVATTFRNRFIGDFVEFGKVQTVWTSTGISDFLNTDRPVKPSGVSGKITLLKVHR